jgi:hypothetical protein
VEKVVFTPPPSLHSTTMALIHPGNYQSGNFSQLRDGPSHQSMGTEGTPLGSGSVGLIMQQRNGWCDCRLGFSIQPYTDGVPPPNEQLPPPSLSMWQSGSCCARVWCTPLFKVFRGDVRKEQMDNEESVPGLAYTHEKPICVLCPQMITRDASGMTVGRTIRECTCCVPSYAVENGSGQVLYTLSPDVCLGCIPKIELSGSGCCQIPWYLRDPLNGEHLANHAHIVHVWTGMKREFCTPNTTVRASYPPQCTNEEKATLLGSTLLITLQARQEAQEREQGGNM